MEKRLGDDPGPVEADGHGPGDPVPDPEAYQDGRSCMIRRFSLVHLPVRIAGVGQEGVRGVFKLADITTGGGASKAIEMGSSAGSNAAAVVRHVSRGVMKAEISSATEDDKRGPPQAEV